MNIERSKIKELASDFLVKKVAKLFNDLINVNQLINQLN